MAVRARGGALEAPSMFASLDANTDRTFERPDVIEFVTSDKYLNKQILYPRQATILKVVFLQSELFTQFDYDVIGEWGENFILPDPDRLAKLGPEDALRYDGNNGIQPDVLDRIEILRERGHLWFREVVSVMGRRASKGFLGGLCGAYVLWHYILKGNPQSHYGIDPTKQLACFVFAAKKDQAKVNQWQDLVDVISGSTCFYDYGGQSLVPPGMPLKESMQLYSPHDRVRSEVLRAKGNTGWINPTFDIMPKESTRVSGRGPASFMQFYDEMAWVEKGIANVSAEIVYGQATPALDQFGKDAFIYEGSSPWQMVGQFYTNWEQALEIDKVTRQPVYPDRLMVQLESWDPYEDWERSHFLPRVPKHYIDTTCTEVEAPKDAKRAEVFNPKLWQFTTREYHRDIDDEPKRFNRLEKSIQEYDESMQLQERANPETFAVERRARWATAQDAYLNQLKVDAMFDEPWNGQRLQMQTEGILSRTYVAHGDPSKSGKNFGFAIGHTEGPDADGLLHVVFDFIHAWRPQDFEPGEDGVRQVNYIEIETEIKGYIRAFIPAEVTFDQFNSVATIQRLQAFVRKAQLPKQVTIWERTATAPYNWKVAETFKSALNLNLLHAPDHELARSELKFLTEANGKVDHPTTGNVQTKDVADALMAVTYSLIGAQMALYIKQDLGSLHPTGAMQGGMQQAAAQAQTEAGLSGWRNGAGRPGGGGPARGRPMPPQGRVPRGSRTGGGVPRIRRTRG